MSETQGRKTILSYVLKSAQTQPIDYCGEHLLGDHPDNDSLFSGNAASSSPTEIITWVVAVMSLLCGLSLPYPGWVT